MTREVYINGVLLRMNEVAHDGLTAVTGADTTQVSTFIVNTFAEAWRRILDILPLHYFPQKALTGTVTPNLTDGTGKITLPADFERIFSLQMTGWKKPVFEAVLNNEYTAALQANEITRGSWIHPVAVLENKSTISYYSLPTRFTSHTIQTAFYIPGVNLPTTNSAEIVTAGSESIGGKYAEPLMWLHASIVYDIFGKEVLSKACKQNILNN